MNELTYEEFCQQPFRHTLGITNDRGAHRLFRNDKLRVQIEIITHRKRYGDIYSGWRTGKSYYYLDSDNREFKNIAELYVAWMARVCGVEA